KEIDVLADARRERRRFRARELILKISNRRPASMLRRNQLSFDFNRCAVRDDEIRFLFRDLAVKFGDVCPRQLRLYKQQRTAGKPADSVEVFGIDAMLAFVVLDLRDAGREIARGYFETDPANELRRVDREHSERKDDHRDEFLHVG